MTTQFYSSNTFFSTGTGLLPGPISDLHATKITDSEVDLTWEPPTDGANVTDYVIHYTQDNTSIHEALLKPDNVSTTNNYLFPL